MKRLLSDRSSSKTERRSTTGVKIRSAMRRTPNRVRSSPDGTHRALLQKLSRVADRLGVDVETLHAALHAMPMAHTIAIMRVNRVTSGLERELGGKDILRKWAHTPIMAFGNRKPVDVLAEGRVEPLERLQAVLEAGVYS